MEHVAADELPNSHGEVGDKADTRDADAGIVFVCRGEVDVSMMVAVRVAVGVGVARVARVAAMSAGLGHESEEWRRLEETAGIRGDGGRRSPDEGSWRTAPDSQVQGVEAETSSG